uniref:DNA 3'-5' helicase n=1 Tax=Solibacter usitatus (strain Ellin6076) TaxID=234267 RepID=Q027X2_SOLUE
MTTTAQRDVTLTPQQSECVNYSSRSLLIRGVPGSGKTVVLLRRARKFAESDNCCTVRILTYNRTLARFAGELVAQLNRPQIQVMTFHSWAQKATTAVMGFRRVVSAPVRRELIERYVAEAKAASPANTLLAREFEFWRDEIAWIKGSLIGRETDYLAAERRGRGSALKAADRSVAWSVYMRYQRALERSQKVDWEDYGRVLLDRIDQWPARLYCDHVLVDEAQDLHPNQLAVLGRMAKRSLTIAADEGQKIYKTAFAWSDLGINVRGGGSKRLGQTFRSTRQIIGLANCLRLRDRRENGSAEESELYDLPDIEGPRPAVWNVGTELKEEEVTIGIVKGLLHDQPDATIGLLARSWDTLYRFNALFREHRLPFGFIKDDDGAAITTAGIKLSTFHGAKGLEFDFVIISRFSENTTPPRADTGADEIDLSVERRLIYVSMTRAKFGLFFTYSGKPSPFIEEFDPSLYDAKSV